MYTPDKARLLKISYDGKTIYKIFATWLGGYLDGDSWKLNSGIESVEQNGDFFDVLGYSGSVYRVHKDADGTSAYSQGVLKQLIQNGESTGATLEILPLSDLATLNSVLKSQNENSTTTPS